MDEADLLQWRPRLRASLVVEREGSELLFISTSDRRVKRFAATQSVVRLIPLLNGEHTVADLVESLCGESEELVGEVCGALLTLREERLLSKSAVPGGQRRSRELTDAQIARYDRQIRLFQEICDSELVDYDEGLAAQERLASATVLVCGVGGLGSVVASSLAAAGVGTLILCDDDVIEESNLNRQLMYSLHDVGKPKVDVLAGRLAGINPQARLLPERRRIEQASDIADLVKRSDLVIGCADQPSVTVMAEITTAACWPDTPHIIGGSYSDHVGILGLLVVPGVTACWHCLLATVAGDHGRDRTEPFLRKNRYGGILGAQSGVIGNLIAWEAIRFVIGMGTALSDRWIELNYGPISFSERTIRRRPDCDRCGRG